MCRNIRKLRLKYILLLVYSSVVLAGEGVRQPAVTTGTLFNEMVDMGNLAAFPKPAYCTVQYSSYDRRSSLPGGPDWFANADGFGGEPIPNFEKVLKAPDADGVGEYLIAEVKGPGAIVRLWTAAIAGDIRMTIDGSPAWEGGADEFFRRPYDRFAQAADIDMGRFSRTIYQRDASYAPIPFAESLRVVWTGNVKEIHFYQLQVRLYDAGTPVASFRPEDIRTYRHTIDQVTLMLSNPDENVVPKSQRRPEPFDLTLQPSERKTVIRLDGPQAIEQLTLHLATKDLDSALRQTMLHVTFDDYASSQVQSPVGDFFGAAPGVNPYRSLPFTVRPDGAMICRFVMPFERACTIELHNYGEQSVTAKGSVLSMPFAWDERAMHFRARWRADHNLTACNRRIQDLPFLLAHGKGLYVGTAVYLMNPCPVPTSYGNWWGEGDEKVFVDDDAVPSIFGTGSEDYFNYSWSSPDIFAFPCCGQPRNDGPGNRGFVANYRWHALDAIPFKNNVRFYMELYSHEPTPGMSYARIAYHYARPGLTDDHRAVMPNDLQLPLLPQWQPDARKGAANAVFFAAEDIAVDKDATRLEAGRLWAGGKLLVWTPRKDRDQKSFLIPVNAAGRHQINIAFALTPRSGTVAFRLDGRPLLLQDRAEVLVLHDPYRTLLRITALAPVDLEAGNHTLTLESKAAADGAADREIGIDFIWLQRR